MKSFYTVGLLIVSNIFMTFAWYGHLKLQQMHISTSWPLIGIIVFSWVIAFFEYCVMVPANRIGFVDNGGPFSLVELKVIQEVISLIIFALVANVHLPFRFHDVSTSPKDHPSFSSICGNGRTL